jgi:hypothetical protein
MREAPPVDYPHVHRLYAWATSSEGGGWFTTPTTFFFGIAAVSLVLFFVFRHWAFLLLFSWFFAAWEKRNGIKEGFILGYEAGHDEAFVGKKDFTTHA